VISAPASRAFPDGGNAHLQFFVYAERSRRGISPETGVKSIKIKWTGAGLDPAGPVHSPSGGSGRAPEGEVRRRDGNNTRGLLT
jgi:hypothetical protein